jgi:predicted ATPase/DNA-binding winged helix-turn-helix (wHTH) protein
VIYRFGRCEVDTDSYGLRVDGQPEPVEPQVFDVLVHLIRHRDRVVTKNELLDEIWGDRFVSESALTSRLKSLRRAVGDDGRAQHTVRTVHGRGYQFVATVREEARAAGGDTPSEPLPAAALPEPPTPLVGRVHDLDVLTALAATTRLLTLTGPGGVGKTRLAVALARALAPAFSDGACFIPLAEVRDAAKVTDFIVDELGLEVGAAGEALRALCERLRQHHLLLVLDNFEHVVEAAPLVSEVLAAAPRVTVLATSRERLRLGGEVVYDVQPLAVDAVGDEVPPALALFEQHAAAVVPGFRLTSGNAGDVHAVCRAVDGLPLAIELAAARVHVLPPQLLRARLTVSLAAAGRRDLPDRQQNVRAAIRWSYDLLAPHERRLLLQLALFAAPVSLEAVEDVWPAAEAVDAVTTLGSLVDKSLVHRVQGRRGEPAYTMLELVKEFGSGLVEELPADERDAVHRRHAEHLARSLAEVEEARWGPAAADWIDVVNERMADIRRAHDWAAAAGAHRLAAAIVGPLAAYWHRQGHHDQGAAWTTQALEWSDELDPLCLGHVRLAAGYLEFARQRLATAREQWAAAQEAYRRAGHERYVAFVESHLAATRIGDPSHYAESLEQCDRCAEIGRRRGELPMVAQALNIKGEIARVQGDMEVARAAYEEALAATRASGDRRHESVVLANFAYLALHDGNPAEARRVAVEALTLCWSLGQRMLSTFSVGELAGAELALGRPERAARLVGASDAALERLRASRHPGDQPPHEQVMAELLAVLGPARLAELRAEGQP